MLRDVMSGYAEDKLQSCSLWFRNCDDLFVVHRAIAYVSFSRSVSVLSQQPCCPGSILEMYNRELNVTLFWSFWHDPSSTDAMSWLAALPPASGMRFNVSAM